MNTFKADLEATNSHSQFIGFKVSDQREISRAVEKCPCLSSPNEAFDLNLNVEAGRNFSLARLTLLKDHLV